MVVEVAGGGERFEFLKRGEELRGPRSCVLEVELRAAGGEPESAGDVQQPVASQTVSPAVGFAAARGRVRRAR
jgi:hypothetical protein